MRERLTGALVAALTAASLVVAGCSPGASPEAPGTAGSATGALPDEPDWHALYQKDLAEWVEAQRQRGLESVPDDVEFVRFIAHEDYGRVHSECMRQQGFAVQETEDNGLEFHDPPEQFVPQTQARYRCMVQYPVHPRYLLPHNEAQIRVMFTYVTETLAPCLRARGYAVADAPSWETYLATYDSDTQYYPYSSVTGLATDQWQEINEACPQHPPAEALYGRGR
ncbi:hypothetical protein [Micromonospora gifhornensis]|uniref:hypothetical protein n=1 Tax=Micromonospora gifhornensis TaxID=84594 RepID=UPI003D71C65D